MKSEAFFLCKKGAADKAFEKREFEIPEPKEHEVLVEVEAFGLNYADVMARNGLYNEAPPMPFIVGYEVVGSVKAVGANGDKSKIGKRVIAFCRFGGYSKHVITNDFATVEVQDQDAAELCSILWNSAKFCRILQNPDIPPQNLSGHTDEKNDRHE